MEYGSLEKEIQIAASPAVVYEVISSPEHIRRWWADEAEMESSPGGTGVLTFGRARAQPSEVRLTVVEAVPGERFAFRWGNPENETPTTQNSCLVTFRITPDRGGALLNVTEEGMRERGWEAAALEDYYDSHNRGWNVCLADLAAYVANLATQR